MSESETAVALRLMSVLKSNIDQAARDLNCLFHSVLEIRDGFILLRIQLGLIALQF
jgi:hypothetical protein